MSDPLRLDRRNQPAFRPCDRRCRPRLRSTAGAVISLLASSPAAQEEAGTLASLVDRADTIASVRAMASSIGVEHRVVFRVVAVLRGSIDDSFELTEPAGQSCGRVLHAVTPGMGYVAFLSTHGTTHRPAVSSARTLVALEPGLLEHIDALLRDPGEATHAATLAAGLASRSPRVRTDAALSLPMQRDLERIGRSPRDGILAALAHSLAAADPGTPGLIRVAARLRLAGALELLLDGLLDGKEPSLERCLERALLAFEPDELADRIASAPLDQPIARARAAAILRTRPSRAARAALTRLLAAPEPTTVIAAGTALLSFGLSDRELEQLTDAEIAARCRACLAEPPAFRTIQPFGASR
jgi:hypothetical protein